MKRQIINWLAASATILVTSVAFAAPPYDAKVYSGSFCQPYHATQSDSIGYPHGAVNRTSHFVWVACPIVRDNVRNVDGSWKGDSTSAGLEVRVRNQANVGSGDNLTCYFKSYSAGSYLLQTDDGYVKPSAAQHGAIELNLDRSSDGGYYTLLCHLPAYSSVLNYQLKEYKSTDDDS